MPAPRLEPTHAESCDVESDSVPLNYRDMYISNFSLIFCRLGVWKVPETAKKCCIKKKYQSGKVRKVFYIRRESFLACLEGAKKSLEIFKETFLTLPFFIFS